MKSVIDFENAIREEYGQAQVDALPWNRIPRGEEARDQMR